MTQYKITFEDRNLKTWKVNDYINLNYVELDNFNPYDLKLFHGDLFNYHNNVFNLIYSSVKIVDNIPGVLILEGGKIYGKENKKKLYKCLPDDKRLPPFLIPYEIKNMGFSKFMVNKYVNFKFLKWEKQHPIGILSQSIGDVNKLDHFYEYQLFCKSLNSTIQNFTKATSHALKEKTEEDFFENILFKNKHIEDRTNLNIFTIDSKNTIDFDDAIGITKEKDFTKISIYISNVSLWLDTLQLWESFSNRVATIYLPDKKRPMLPTILSNSLCSLKENVKRFAFTMDIYLQDNVIVETKFVNSLILVKKNYYHNDKSLKENKDYNRIFAVLVDLLPSYKYIPSIQNSFDVISYLMIFMNYYTAKHFEKYDNGIFRTSFYRKDKIIPHDIPDEIHKFMKIWSASSGQYVKGSSPHEILELDAYLHITSPIRRLVDLLNLIKIQKNLNLLTIEDENKIDIFYNTWIKKLDYINTTMRAIRKVQIDCTMLELCTNNPDIREKEHSGYLFDKVERSDGLFQYIVYLPELKIVSKITSREDKNNYESGTFQIFLFEDEEKIKKKIRLHLIK